MPFNYVHSDPSIIVQKKNKNPFFNIEGNSSQDKFQTSDILNEQEGGERSFFSPAMVQSKLNGNQPIKKYEQKAKTQDQKVIQKAPPESVPQSVSKADLEFTSKKFHKAFPRFDLTYVPKGPDPKQGTTTVSMKVYFRYSRKVKKSIRDTFAKDFESMVEKTWSDKYPLVLKDPKMKRYKTDVKVDVVEVFDKKKANFTIHVAPRPKKFRSNVDDKKWKVNLDDNDATNRDELRTTKADYFRQVGPFDHDSDIINPDVQYDLDDVTRFLGGIPKNTLKKDDAISLEYTGRTNSIGNTKYNEKLAGRRIDTVKRYIESKFPTMVALSMFIENGEKNTTKDAKFRRVDVKIDLSDTKDPEKAFQNTAAHEAGHMFGLDDEYIEEKKDRFEGDRTGYYNTVQDVAGTEAAEEMQASQSESIMSRGMKVLKGHYMSFAIHLRKLTGNDHWFIE